MMFELFRNKTYTEVIYLIKPIPFSVHTYSPEDLFAGKTHVVLCKPCKIRIKGRDWYDLIWYVANGFHLRLSHLETRMRQSGHYSSAKPLTNSIFNDLLEKKIVGLNLQAAKDDLQRFVQDPRQVDS